MIGSLTLVGGGISGQGHVVVQGPTVLLANGSNDSGPSSLKNGVTLEMYGGGVWRGGDLQARDGATVVNLGLFEVVAEDEATFGAGKERQPTRTINNYNLLFSSYYWERYVSERSTLKHIVGW